MKSIHFLGFNSILVISILTINYFYLKKFKKLDSKLLSDLEFHNGVKYFHTDQEVDNCNYLYKLDEFNMDDISQILDNRAVTNKKINKKKNQIYSSINDRSEKDFKQIYGIVIRDCFTNFVEISKYDDNEKNIYLYIEI